MVRSQTAHFTQADFVIPVSTLPISYDRYSYTLNNPIRFTDPSGHSVDCGIGDNYCHAGKLDLASRALDVANEKSTNAKKGTTLMWNGLSNSERSILTEGGWTEGVYQDHLSGGVSPADTWHDPLTYIQIAVLGNGLLKAAPILLSQFGSRFPQSNEDIIQIPSSRIRFTQNSISPFTKTGVPLDTLTDEISNGYFNGYIRVTNYLGNLWSLDNRRLAAFKLLDAVVPAKVLPFSQVATEFSQKYTTTTNGLSIIIRNTTQIIR
jgi:hypothetical protein